MSQPGSILVRVREATLLSPTLKRLTLEAADGSPLPPAAPGAHVRLHLKGEARVWTNAYSLVSEAGRRSSYDIIVRRLDGSRGGSRHVHERLGPGDIVDMTPPANLFPLVASARKHLLISGGVGVTPMLAFLPELLAGTAAFELHQFAAPAEAGMFQTLLAPYGSTAWVHARRATLDLPALMSRQPLGTHVYTCGPAELMQAVAAAAAATGWPETNVHRESFGAASGGAPFIAVLARSALTIEVGPEETLLEALETAGIDAPNLCRGGACGHCAVRVLDGVPDHRDDYLSPAERAGGALIMTCMSRAKTPRLVLDI